MSSSAMYDYINFAPGDPYVEFQQSMAGSGFVSTLQRLRK